MVFSAMSISNKAFSNKILWDDSTVREGVSH